MVACRYFFEVLFAPRLGKRFRGVGRTPLMSSLGRTWGCNVLGISMNFGFSGPMAERGFEVLKGLALRHAKRGRALNWPAGSEGGIVKSACARASCADEDV